MKTRKKKSRPQPTPVPPRVIRGILNSYGLTESAFRCYTDKRRYGRRTKFALTTVRPAVYEAACREIRGLLPEGAYCYFRAVTDYFAHSRGNFVNFCIYYQNK